jgi:peroxiredoxin
LALSPSRPEFARQIAKKNNLDFPILSDTNNLVAKQFRLVFSVAMELRDVYRSFGIDLERHNGNSNWELPLPATYIIKQNGIIAFAKANIDHTFRLEPDELLSQLDKL